MQGFKCFFFALLLLSAGAERLLPSSTRQYGAWAACSGVSGVCIDTSVYTCSTATLFNRCPGGSNIRCCPSPGGVKAGSCFSEGLGLCTRTVTCPRSVITQKCPGPSGITCCPKSTQTAPPRTTPPTATTTRPATTRATTRSGDVASGVSCQLYRTISSRGRKICTDECRPFGVNTRLPDFLGGKTIEDIKARVYLHNAYCACTVTPSGNVDSDAFVVRRCLQQRLIDASRAGKTVWTPGEIEEDHKICYRAANCPCGPAFSTAWEIVSLVPDPFSCNVNDLGIQLFGNCHSCTARIPQNGPPITYQTCFGCPNF